MEEAARLARLANERAAALRDAQQEERRQLAESRRLTFQQKVLLMRRPKPLWDPTAGRGLGASLGLTGAHTD